MKVIKDSNGEKLYLYHGTNRKYEDHSSDRHRTLLNEDYQGDWYCFVPSQDVGWKYADAARNQNLDKQFFLEDVKKVFSAYDLEVANMMEDLSLCVMEKGLSEGMDDAIKIFAKRNDISDENKEIEFFRKLSKCEDELGINVNDFCDVLDYVEYSKSGHSDSLREVFNILESRVTEIPYFVIEDITNWGFEKSLPSPRLLEVSIQAENVLETSSRKEARNAKENGYDLVIYSGEGIVDGVPEYLVADNSQIIKEAVTLRHEKREEVYDDSEFYPSTVITQSFERIEYDNNPKKKSKRKLRSN